MYQSRGVSWIGFQEAQKAIDALKEEVTVAEKKLSNAKRSLKYERELSPVRMEKVLSKEKYPKPVVSHFHKETIPKKLYSQEKNIKRLKTGVPKPIEGHEHSKQGPPHVTKPSDLKETLVKTVYESALTKTSSSETSASLLDIHNKISPSEASLSLLSDTYKCVDAELSLKITRQENIENKDPSDISFNSWEKEYLKRINSTDGEGIDTTLSPQAESEGDVFWAPINGEGNLSKRSPKLKSINKQVSTSNQYVPIPENVSNEMEWRPVSSGEKFPSSKPKKRSGSYLALKQIIERQKKFHEEIQGRSDAELQSVSTAEPLLKTCVAKRVASVDIQIKPPPLRKKCHVSTLPQYKGFSVPGFSPVSDRRNRPMKKATRYISEIKITDNFEAKKDENVKSGPSFEMKEIVIENNMQISEPIAPDLIEKEKPFPESSSSEKVSSSSDSPIQRKHDNLLERITTPEKEISPKSNSPVDESYSETFGTSSESPKKSRRVKDEVTLQRDISKTPTYSKSTKRKAGKMYVEERTAPSPKIRHYDVNEVRDYIKKKKEERKKRHQEERKKSMEEVQKKKESLQRLYEYQKSASMPAIKNISPLKASKTSENVQESMSSKRLFTEAESSSKRLTEIIGLSDASIEPRRDPLVPEADSEFSHPSVSLFSKQFSNKTETLEYKAKSASESIEVRPKGLPPSVKRTESLKSHMKKNTRFEEKGFQTELSEPKHANSSSELNQDFHFRLTVSKDQETQTNRLKNNSLSLGTLHTSQSTKEPPLSIDNQSYNMPSFISTISTPSQFSLSSNINAELPDELKFEKFKLPSFAAKQEQVETLKNLVQSINHITAPFENIMRTKAWIEQSPPPPKHKSSSKVKPSKDIPSKKGSGDGKYSTDFVFQVAESLYCANESSSFKQEVTNVGDTNELFQKILGPQTHLPNQAQSFSRFEDENQLSITSNHNISLVEGPLNSGDDTVTSEKYPTILDNYSAIEGSLRSVFTTVLTDNSEHPALSGEKRVSIFAAPSTNPDPFNFINTWNRKPLGFQEAPLKINLPFSNLPDTNLLPKSDSNENKNYSNETFSSMSVHSSTEFESMSVVTDEHSKQESSKNSRNVTDDNSLSESSSLDNSTIKGSVTKSSAISSDVSRKHKSSDSYNDNQNQNIPQDNKNPPSISESSVSEAISVIENSKSVCQKSLELSNLDEERDEISLLKSTKNEPDIVESAHSPSDSIAESVKEKSEAKNEIADSKSSESIPDLSGLVEEGYLSSSGNMSVRSVPNGSEVLENVNLNRYNSSRTETIPSENFSEKDERSNSSKSEVLSQDENDGSSPTGIVSEKVIDHKTSSAEKLRMDSISELSSPNTVNIDLAQPLQLTISNGVTKSLKVHKSISLHKEEYLHTQVVTRVASEAAAAAATSAVIAVFETQRELLSRERNLPSTSTFVSSSQSSPQFESLSDKASESSGSTSKKSSPIASEEINEDIAVNESPLSTVKEALSSAKESTSKSASLHSTKSKPENIKKLSRSRKISGNISSPSPASLTENDSLSHSIEMIASSVVSSSTLDESILSDDSFTQLTLEVVRKKTLEEELRASHKLAYLKFQEKTLVENARAEMAWFESLKKKLREKGSNKKASFIKKKQKELVLRLRQERAQLRCMQEAYRSMCDKRQLTDDPNLLASLSSKRKEKSLDSKTTSDTKGKELSRPESESTSTIVTADDEVIDEEYPDPTLEMLKSIASVSSQGSAVETIISEQAKSSMSSHSKSLKASSQSFPHTKQGHNQSNVSLNSVNSVESAAQGFKKLESSKRHLTKREQRILQRRKHVERLLQWQMKLDSEEMAVRELEQKAVELVDNSKKRTKYYVSTSPCTIQNESEKQSVAESPETESKISENLKRGASTDRSPSTVKSETIPESSPTNSIPEENSIPATSTNSVEEILSNKGSNDPDSSVVSTTSIKEVESNQTESPVKTVEDNTESSNAEEVNTNEGTYPSSKSVDQKSLTSDVYSESFESTASHRASNNNSSTTIKTPPSTGSKKEKSFSIKSPLAPRSFRRHDSSGSDDSYTISHSETASDQSDIEVRIHALSEELRRRKHEAEKLKREQKRKYREHLKGKELSLQKQVEAYNNYIQQVKLDLERIEAISSVPPVETSPVKPQIKWPRSENTGDSRRIRKQSSISSDPFSEKRAEGVTGSSDSIESHIDISHKKEKIIMKNLFPESKEKPNFKTEGVPEIEKPLSRRDSSSNSSKLTSNITTLSSDKEIPENIDSGTLQEAIKSSFEKTPSEASVKSKEETEIEESLETPLSSIDTVSSYNENEDPASSSRRKSSYPSESFASNSSSSQSSDNSTVQKPTVHTIASDDYESRGNSLESVEEMHGSDASINTALNESVHSSEPETTPESSLVTNTGSAKDDFGSGDFESSEHSSTPIPPKTTESSTVESSSKVQPSGEIKLVGEVPLGSLQIEKPLSKQAEKPSLNEKLKSETFVVNVVNYIYSSIFDDAIKIVLSLSRKNTSGLKLNHLKPSEVQDISKAQSKSSHLKKKLDDSLVEKISNSLLDSYLDEAICSVINIAKSFQKQPAIESGSHVPVSTSDSKSSSETSIFSAQSDDDFSVNYSIVASHDKNDNIFGKQSNWFDDSVLGNQWESQQLEQQLLLQHYPYFYRKIPNKPPPPYTPPSSAAVSSMLPLRKDKPVERVDTIEYVTKNLKVVVEHITDTLISGMEKGVKISEMTEPDLNCLVQKLGLTLPCQLTFLDMIFDLSRETSLNLFCETEEVIEPWLKPRKLTPKPFFPEEKSKLSAALYKELHHSLRLQPKDLSPTHWKKPSWSTMKLGRKKRDFVDTILISELKEEEPDWVNYDHEEVTVKFQIADYIFDILVDDTASLIQKLDQSILSK